MKILAINGSPHTDGNTSYATKYALTLLKSEGCDTEYIALADKTIHGCKGCFYCQKEGKCIQNDDMKDILEAMEKCDCLILSSPVYLGSVSGQIKTMMDRTLPLRITDDYKMSGKIGAGIAIGYFRNGGQELTLQCMHAFFLQQDMFVINDGPDYCHSGATIVEDAKKDKLGLETIENLAKNIVKKLQLIKGK